MKYYDYQLNLLKRYSHIKKVINSCNDIAQLITIHKWETEVFFDRLNKERRLLRLGSINRLTCKIGLYTKHLKLLHMIANKMLEIDPEAAVYL